MAPTILVTNDDGFFADGIAVLARELAVLGDVVVVAPDRNQSAVSHKISLYQPVRAQEIKPRLWSVDGTPTDCTYLGVVELLPQKPSLVVSGINAGPNLSQDVHYSGTVSGAVEATMLGVPAIAVSALVPNEETYAAAAAFTRELARHVLRHGLPAGVTLNVNVPKGSPKAYAWTSLGVRPYEHAVERRTDPRGRVYFWIGGEPTAHHDVPGSDCNAVASGLISVTPIQTDVTARAFLDASLGAAQPQEFPGFEARQAE
ncbi:MAG: 5'/3'-nucleotidase SurE [Deltaproteobacteria bacterium]|nr:5'/3'-nucleotidase SurE [Deltaproteobacteria bacterium]